MTHRFLCSWSGGKDSCYAFMMAKQEGLQPAVLLNVLNEAGKISRSHGIPSAILEAQAKAMDIPIFLISSSWKDYEQNFIAALKTLTEKYELSSAVFGDIDLQPHRDWEEKVCNAAAISAVLPLWQRDRLSLVMEMLDNKIETIIVSCNEKMGEGFLGQTLTAELVNELQELGIDPCGENGEFHTLVTNCPLFTEGIKVEITNKVLHEGYWFSELKLF